MYQSGAKVEAFGLNFEPFVETETPAEQVSASGLAKFRLGDE